jgi:post-segregation antitoxin (ccd killing protein)
MTTPNTTQCLRVTIPKKLANRAKEYDINFDLLMEQAINNQINKIKQKAQNEGIEDPKKLPRQHPNICSHFIGPKPIRKPEDDNGPTMEVVTSKPQKFTLERKPKRNFMLPDNFGNRIEDEVEIPDNIGNR